MKILIALDVSHQCREIIAELAARPWPAGSSFLLIHVLDPFPFAKAPISLQRAKKEAEALLKNAGKRLCAEGWAVDEEVVLGRARQAIAKIAGSWKANLVVVGSHEAGALTRLFLGSTARAVLRDAPCSVEIVRPRLDEAGPVRDAEMKILVGTDGSEYSTIALQSLANRPWPEGTKFKVISLPEPFMPLREFPYLEMKEIERLNASTIHDAERYAKAGAEILRKNGLDVDTDTPLPCDSDAREIVKEAEKWGAHMIVVGSHGLRGFDRWTLGSVSEHVALHAPCSVEVIRGSSAADRKPKKTARKD